MYYFLHLKPPLTLTEKKSESGSVSTTTSRDNTASSRAQQPGPVVSAEGEKIFQCFRMFNESTLSMC